MASSFFFYDLETSGINARSARIMQFAGVRTDMDLNPIGEPVNIVIKLTPDVLPEPDAILITGITPQQTLQEGITEAEFLKFFYEEVVQPDTIFLGFNTVRFDDKFMHFLNYRNFYDAYEWQWRDGCSKWDLLDVVRMTRALRPDGIEWPFSADGKPTNRLELLTKVNGLDHQKAHDALNDVYATIAVAKLIKEKQPKLFSYLLNIRSKKEVATLLESGAPFVYASGRYPSNNLHTTVSVLLTKNSKGEGLVYDLRHDPTQFLDMNTDELIKCWSYNKDPEALCLPVKTVKFNHCPAVAPLAVLDDASKERINISQVLYMKNLELLKPHKAELAKKLLVAVEKMDQVRKKKQTGMVDDPLTVDARLYDSFFSDHDKTTMRAMRSAQPDALGEFTAELRDARLQTLLPLYKARNYPSSLTADERQAWDEFCAQKLFTGGQSSQLAKFFERLSELAATRNDAKSQYLLEELQLYGQSLMPIDVS